MNKPEIRFEYDPGTENIGADLLSRPCSDERSKDIDGQDVEVNKVFIWEEIWTEHMKGHWGAFNTFKALQQKGSAALWNMLKRICKLCEVCAKFRHRCARVPFGQPV